MIFKFIYKNNFFLLFFYSLSIFAALNNEQKKELWEAAYQQLAEHPRLVYDNQAGIPTYPGYIVSREAHFHSVAPLIPSSPGQLYVGFGSTQHFSLLGARSGEEDTEMGHEITRTAIFAEPSPAVLVTLMSFWRTLFLATESPEEMVAAIFKQEQLPVCQESCPLGSVICFLHRFNGSPNLQYHIREQPVPRGLIERLESLEERGEISAVDKNITLATLEEFYDYEKRDPHKEFFSLYPRIEGSSHLQYDIARTYDPLFTAMERESRAIRNCSFLKIVQEIGACLGVYDKRAAAHRRIQQVVHNSKKVSFLLNPRIFNRVRNIFIEGKDYYAKATLEDKAFWGQVKYYANDVLHLDLTDIFTSCVPFLYNRGIGIKHLSYQEDIHHNLDLWLKDIRGQEKTVYESLCCSAEPVYQTRIFSRDSQ